MHTYLDDDFNAEYREWLDFKRYGFRYSGGKAEQPANYIDILNIFEEEHARWKNNK